MRHEITAEQRFFEVYKLVSEAEKVGGNVSSLVVKINESLKAFEIAKKTGNSSMIEDVISQLNRIEIDAIDIAEAGATASRSSVLYITLSITFLIAIGLFSYMFVPKLFWWIWIRSKRGWKVRA